MKQRDFALALLVVTVWGANFTVVKLALTGVPPLLLVALRFVLVVFPAIFFVRRPAVSLWYWVTYGATVGIGQFGCGFYAMHIGMPAGVSSVVLQSQVFFTLLFAAILLRERISSVQLVGLVISSLGLYLVWCTSGSATVLTIPPAAFLLSIAGAAFWGISNVVVRKAAASAAEEGTQLDIISLIVWSSLIPPIPLFLFSLVLDTPQVVIAVLVGNLDMMSMFSIAYLAYASTLLGFGLWSNLLSKYPASQVAPLSFLVPVTGLLTARIVLGEQLFLLQWGGCLLVLAGLLISSFGFPNFLRSRR